MSRTSPWYAGPPCSGARRSTDIALYFLSSRISSAPENSKTTSTVGPFGPQMYSVAASRVLRGKVGTLALPTPPRKRMLLRAWGLTTWLTLVGSWPVWLRPCWKTCAFASLANETASSRPHHVLVGSNDQPMRGDPTLPPANQNAALGTRACCPPCAACRLVCRLPCTFL